MVYFVIFTLQQKSANLLQLIKLSFLTQFNHEKDLIEYVINSAVAVCSNGIL